MAKSINAIPFQLKVVRGRAHSLATYSYIRVVKTANSAAYLVADDEIAWVPLAVVRYMAEVHLGIPFESQYEWWLSHLVVQDFVCRDVEWVRAAPKSIDVFVARDILRSFVRLEPPSIYQQAVQNASGK